MSRGVEKLHTLIVIVWKFDTWLVGNRIPIADNDNQWGQSNFIRSNYILIVYVCQVSPRNATTFVVSPSVVDDPMSPDVPLSVLALRRPLSPSPYKKRIRQLVSTSPTSPTLGNPVSKPLKTSRLISMEKVAKRRRKGNTTSVTSNCSASAPPTSPIMKGKPATKRDRDKSRSQEVSQPPPAPKRFIFEAVEVPTLQTVLKRKYQRIDASGPSGRTYLALFDIWHWASMSGLHPMKSPRLDSVDGPPSDNYADWEMGMSSQDVSDLPLGQSNTGCEYPYKIRLLLSTTLQCRFTRHQWWLQSEK